jgi:tetratricopeptide (TPR) repeat protein
MRALHVESLKSLCRRHTQTQTDAEEAIKLNSQYAKAHHRLGVAKLGLARYQDALPHFRRVCVLEPQDAAARAKLQEVQQLVKKIAFEEAIRFEEESPFNNFDYEAMGVCVCARVCWQNVLACRRGRRSIRRTSDFQSRHCRRS